MAAEKTLVVSAISGIIVGAIVFEFKDQSSGMELFLQACFLIGFTLFLGLLKLLIIPLVATSLVVAANSGEGSLGRSGFIAGLYYISTMLVAVVLGLLIVTSIKPGGELERQNAISVVAQDNSNEHLLSQVSSNASGGLTAVFENLLKMLVPENIFSAMVKGETLGVVVFFLFFGLVIRSLGDSAKAVREVFQALFNVFMKMVELVLFISPLGVFCLIVWSIASVGLGVFGSAIGSYLVCVLLGLAIHALVILPLTYYVFIRSNPYRFLLQIKRALLTAFATSSSSATLPISIETVTEKGGVSEKNSALVLSLGSTINMDGTALYEAVAVVFLAQAAGIILGPAQLTIIAITATLAAIGAAGIPSAGLVTMLIVVDAVNGSILSMNPESSLIPVAGIGLILGVDRFLDMFRTTVNVWGDCVGAKIVDSLE